MEKKEKLYMHINVRMDREVDKQEYLWNYVSSYLGSMGLEYLGTSEYQPLERMPEETKESNSTPLEPLQNGEREMNPDVKRFVEYWADDFSNIENVKRFTRELFDLLSQSKKEGIEEGLRLKRILNYEECVMVEPRYISDCSDKYNKHYKCKRCESKCLIPVIEPLVVICPKCGELDLDEIESLTNQKKEDEKE